VCRPVWQARPLKPPAEHLQLVLTEAPAAYCFPSQLVPLLIPKHVTAQTAQYTHAITKAFASQLSQLTTDNRSATKVRPAGAHAANTLEAPSKMQGLLCSPACDCIRKRQRSQKLYL
jgi:hypothetical protein